MRIPRIYHPVSLSDRQEITLTDDAANHIVRVLRMKLSDQITLFDGSNFEYPATLCHIDKKSAQVILGDGVPVNVESPLHLHLGQVISRGEKMEFTIQKSVELGISVITPLLSERCGVKLDKERFEKKMQQWQKIIISACEQCGRNTIPQLMPVTTLEAWCAQSTQALKLNLHPRATSSINTLPPASEIRLLIGPEGGLSDSEIAMTGTQGFTDVLLGPRVLRTETAALTAITALQVRFGDLG